MDSWVSGDYAAATDTLDIRHTKAAFEASLACDTESNLSPRYQELLRSVLYEQGIHYPEKLLKRHGASLEPAQQVTGQLMGSTQSFPILCTVNLCAYWKSLEEYTGRKFNLADLPVLVNGDDILFRCTASFYKIWLKNISDVGFELSLGKNYVCPDYLTVNSVLYHYQVKKDQLGNDTARFSLQGYLNPGLLTGQARATGREGTQRVPLWDYFNTVVAGALNPERAHMRFIHYYRDEINQLTRYGKFNLFVSPLKGGLGFNRCGDVYATAFQRRWADFMDNELRNNPADLSKITLIQERGIKDHRREHVSKFVVMPKMGPYEKGVVPIVDTKVSLPILSVREEAGELQELVVRHPKQRTLERFREGDWRPLKGSIWNDRFRLMEYQGTRELQQCSFASPLRLPVSSGTVVPMRDYMLED
jgi:hypothetical protein